MIKNRFCFCQMQGYLERIKMPSNNNCRKIKKWLQPASHGLFQAGRLWMERQIYPRNETGNGKEIHANIFHVDDDYLKT